MLNARVFTGKRLKILALIAWMLLIFFASGDSSSGEHSGSILRALFAFFGLPLSEGLHFWLRKGAHFTEYAILFGLWRWNTGKDGLSLLLSILYAASDEWHQAFVPHRGPSPWDVGVDSLGALTGCMLGKVASRSISLLRESRRSPLAARPGRRDPVRRRL